MTASNLVYRHNRITRLTHWLNALALMILLMSGLMIFNAHPHLYLGHTSEPGKEVLSIGATEHGGTKRGHLDILGMKINTTGVLGVQRTASGTTLRAFPTWATVPGYYSLAGARRWHFFFGWLFSLTGLIYVAYNLAVGHMNKFLFTPADAARVPAMIAYYLKLRKDSPQIGEYNPLQKMAYTSVFLLLAPIILLSGMAMSPQLNVAFNWLPAIFGGRQSARTMHFMIAFGILFFAFGHVFMVVTQGFLNNMRSMVTGWYREKVTHQDTPAITVTTEPLPAFAVSQRRLPLRQWRQAKMAKLDTDFSRRGLLLGALNGAAFLIFAGCEKAFNSLSRSETVSSLLAKAESANRRVQRSLASRHKLAQEFSEKDISPKFRSNGNPPPITAEYAADAANQFSNWKLEVTGLVKQPASLSLVDLQALPSRTQITRHDCVEGWSAIAKWKGVRLEEIINQVQPTPEAKYVVIRCMDGDSDGANYYESIDLIDAVHPQTILAYEMNGKPLPVANGAPLRLRVENQLGYKQAKYIKSLEFVASFDKIASGKGGYWEDEGYEWYAGI